MALQQRAFRNGCQRKEVMPPFVPHNTACSVILGPGFPSGHPSQESLRSGLRLLLQSTCTRVLVHRKLELLPSVRRGGGRCMRMHNDNHSAKGAMQVASVVSSKLTYSACPSPRKAKQARPRASTKRGCRHQAAPLLHRCAAHRCTSLRSNGSQAQDVRRMCAGCAQDVCRMCGGYVRDPAAGTCIMLSTASDTTGC